MKHVVSGFSRNIHLAAALAVLSLSLGCRTMAPPIQFGPQGLDPVQLRADFPLSDAERLTLTPENMRALTQEQVDQIYARLSSGAISDGPFRGDLFFPRGTDGRARIGDLADPSLPLVRNIAALRAESLGAMLWKGKVLFRLQGLVRNRIDDLLILRPFVGDTTTIPKLTFDDETTWLLFPATLACGIGRFDASRPSTLIDYARTAELDGFRAVPDGLAGPQGLAIFDEIRIVRRGFYLGRSYFGPNFALNFTLLDPAVPADSSALEGINADCQS